MPPLVGVAVNVTDVPAQMVLPGFAAIDTEGVSIGLTVIVMPLLVAVAGVAHVALLVNTHVTTSLLLRVVLEYVVLLVPTLVLFTFHW